MCVESTESPTVKDSPPLRYPAFRLCCSRCLPFNTMLLPLTFTKITYSTAPVSQSLLPIQLPTFEHFLPPPVSCRLFYGASVLLLPSGSFWKYPPAFLAASAQVLSADSHRRRTVSRSSINSPKQSNSVYNSSKADGMPAFLLEALTVRLMEPLHLSPMWAVIGLSSSYTWTCSVFDSIAVVSLALLNLACAGHDAAGLTDGWVTHCGC